MSRRNYTKCALLPVDERTPLQLATFCLPFWNFFPDWELDLADRTFLFLMIGLSFFVGFLD
jgi:hypothetical protein